MLEINYKKLKGEIFKISILSKLVKKDKKEIIIHLDRKPLTNDNDELGYFNFLEGL